MIHFLFILMLLSSFWISAMDVPVPEIDKKPGVDNANGKLVDMEAHEIKPIPAQIVQDIKLTLEHLDAPGFCQLLDQNPGIGNSWQHGHRISRVSRTHFINHVASCAKKDANNGYVSVLAMLKKVVQQGYSFTKTNRSTKTNKTLDVRFNEKTTRSESIIEFCKIIRAHPKLAAALINDNILESLGIGPTDYKDHFHPYYILENLKEDQVDEGITLFKKLADSEWKLYASLEDRSSWDGLSARLEKYPRLKAELDRLRIFEKLGVPSQEKVEKFLESIMHPNAQAFADCLASDPKLLYLPFDVQGKKMPVAVKVAQYASQDAPDFNNIVGMLTKIVELKQRFLFHQEIEAFCQHIQRLPKLIVKLHEAGILEKIGVKKIGVNTAYYKFHFSPGVYLQDPTLDQANGYENVSSLIACYQSQVGMDAADKGDIEDTLSNLDQYPGLKEAFKKKNLFQTLNIPEPVEESKPALVEIAEKKPLDSSEARAPKQESDAQDNSQVIGQPQQQAIQVPNLAQPAANTVPPVIAPILPAPPVQIPPVQAHTLQPAALPNQQLVKNTQTHSAADLKPQGTSMFSKKGVVIGLAGLAITALIGKKIWDSRGQKAR